MGHWNYRLFKEPTGGVTIRDVYYENDIPKSYSATPAYPCGTDETDMRIDLHRMIDCMLRPALSEEDFK